MMLFASCDADENVIDIMWCKQYVMQTMVLHNQKCHVIPHIHHLDLRNAVVPLMMPLHYVMLMMIPWMLCDASDDAIECHMANSQFVP